MSRTCLALTLALLAIGGDAAAQTYAVPVRWCTIGNDANDNGVADAGEEGAPAFTSPAGVAEPDTDNVLWRRHERPSDAVFIPEAQVTFRSAIYNIVEDPLLRFPIIPDPDPNPTGDAFWLYGDVLSSSGSPSAEWNAAHNACVDAWRERHGVEDIGIVVLNVNHYRSLGGDSEPGAAVLGGRRMILRDNAYVLPGSPLYGAFESPPDPTIVGDHVDKHFGHEMGHALAGLRHTCSNQNIMSNRRLDPSGDNLVDNIHLSTSIEEIVDTADCPATDLPAVNQIALVRNAAKATPGCKIAGTNTDCTIRSDVRADRIKDAPLPFLDLSLVTISDEGAMARLAHEPMGPLDKRRFGPRDHVDYYVFVDQDRDPSTGGDVAALGVPVRFKGAELATRVRVWMQREGFAFVPTVWRHQAGSFVEQHGRIRAYGRPLVAVTERGNLHLTDQINLELSRELFGATDDFRVQAAVVPTFGAETRVVDVLDDGRERPGREFRWRSPTFPVCTVAPAVQRRGRPITVKSEGLLPNQGVHLVFGPRHIANGHADAGGAVTVTTAVPADARDGQHLVTVGTDGTALTADCLVTVRGGRKPRRPQVVTPPRPPVRAD